VKDDGEHALTARYLLPEHAVRHYDPAMTAAACIEGKNDHGKALMEWAWQNIRRG